MATLVNMHKAKTELSRLVASALAGEEIIITRDGKPVARLVPIRSLRKPGSAKGKIRLNPNWDAPLPEEILRGFEGEGCKDKPA